jgi:7-keto-8-aminopelargonate synthetase-like enzyme
MENLSTQVQSVFDNFIEGKNRKMMGLTASDIDYDGKILHIDGKKTTCFVQNTYLGLNTDIRVKQATIEFVERYGVHSAIQRTYLSFEHYLEAEKKLEQIFELPVYLSSNTTMGHFSYLPMIIGKKDAVIFDQFVHKSVQMAVQYLKGDNIYVEVLRHNNMQNLEDRIKYLSTKYDKVWYLADGIYSMHGDGAPILDIKNLLNLYPQFYAYLDDAHGMSWIGKNGKGYVLHNLPKHDKLFAIASLNKGFGAYCSAMIFPNEDYKKLVSTLGPTSVFSAMPIHATIGATIAISDIHLSDEIYEKQMILNENLKFTYNTAQKLNLPLSNSFHTPVCFIGVQNLENLYEIGRHLVENGFITSIASYPAVPDKHSGLRISITTEHNFSEINDLLTCIDDKMNTMEILGKINRDEIRCNFENSIKRKKTLV